MINLSHYNVDGACSAARATLAYLQLSKIEASWSNKHNKYLAVPKVARWENCREQGYVIILHSKCYIRQLNIAFFEHRNSDEICAIKWEQCTMNSPTIETAEFGDIYKDKNDLSYRVSYTNIFEMVKWIQNEMETFWCSTIDKSQP